MTKVVCSVLYQAGCTSTLSIVMLIITLLLSFFFTALGQPLTESAEMFACGKQHCPRWGYYTCIASEGGDYCLPCNHDQLEGHCGTQREYIGCNLYCTDKATSAAIEYLNENYTRSTLTLADKLNASLQEASNLRSRNEALLKEKTVAESQLTVLALAITSAVLVLVVIILAAFLLYHCRRKRKIKTDVENNQNLMNNLSSTKETSEKSFTANFSSSCSVSSAESVNETDNLLEGNDTLDQNKCNRNQRTENGKGGCRDPRLGNVPVSDKDGKTANAFG